MTVQKAAGYSLIAAAVMFVAVTMMLVGQGRMGLLSGAALVATQIVCGAVVWRTIRTRL